MTTRSSNVERGVVRFAGSAVGTALRDLTTIDEQLVDEIEARWRRECEHHASQPAPLRSAAPSVLVTDVLAAIGMDASRSDDAIAVDAEMAFNCGDLHVAVAQLSALRRVIATTLALSGRSLDRLEEVVERAMTEVVKGCVDDLCNAALLDPLTGLRNRRAFVADARGELAKASRDQRPVSVALVDMVGLKHLNDDQSHAVGDQALRRLGRVLRDIVREGDDVYRIGGDEFVVLLPGASSDDTSAILNRVNGDGCAFRWGVAGSPADGVDVDTLVDVADRRMLEFRRSDGYTDHGPGSRLSGRQD